MKKTKKIKISKKITISFLFLAIITLIFSVFVLWLRSENGFKEIADNNASIRLYNKLIKIPNIKIKNIWVLTYTSGATIEIPNKGIVSLTYEAETAELMEINWINNITTNFQCVDINKLSEYPQSVFVQRLDLRSEDSYFYPWFPFTLKTTEDVIANFDRIENTLKSLPESREPGYTFIMPPDADEFREETIKCYVSLNYR